MTDEGDGGCVGGDFWLHLHHVNYKSVRVALEMRANEQVRRRLKNKEREREKTVARLCVWIAVDDEKRNLVLVEFMRLTGVD